MGWLTPRSPSVTKREWVGQVGKGSQCNVDESSRLRQFRNLGKMVSHSLDVDSIVMVLKDIRNPRRMCEVDPKVYAGLSTLWRKPSNLEGRSELFITEVKQ